MPAAPKVEPPKPDPIYVQAAKRRRRIPIWAMPVLAAIPLWSYVYVRTLEPAPIENDPFELGAEHFTPCAACHGGKGQGAGAPQLSDGKVQETWGDYRDHIMWVKLGADKWPGQTYGDDAVSKDANGSKMPSYGSSLTDQEIAQVVLYERRVLSNEEPPEGEDDLLAIANGEKTFAEVVADQGLGPTAIRDGVPESEAEG